LDEFDKVAELAWDAKRWNASLMNFRREMMGEMTRTLMALPPEARLTEWAPMLDRLTLAIRAQAEELLEFAHEIQEWEMEDFLPGQDRDEHG